MNGWSASRAVAVCADLGASATGKRFQHGSGFLIDDRTVLTAAHVVRGAVEITVRSSTFAEQTAEVERDFLGDDAKWGPGRSDAPDLALLRLEKSVGRLTPLPVALIDRANGASLTIENVEAVGYPLHAENDAARLQHPVTGTLLLSNREDGLLNLNVTVTPVAPQPDAKDPVSPWAGMSGAVVAVSGHLIGVITEHGPASGTATVDVVPFTAIDPDPEHPHWGAGFNNSAQWWSRLGVPDKAKLRVLPQDQADIAVVGQLRTAVIAYLNTTVQDLSTDPWPRDNGERVLSITDLERSLTVTTGDQQGVRAADEVADSSQRLVVLAGPGAGKTWLARRIVRRAAVKALAQLDAGAHLGDVELPLLVTCEQFRGYDGSAREAAVWPAVDSRPDFGAEAAERVKTHLSRRESQVLLVLDSLDEATSKKRDVDQARIANWRTVITSRPASWLGQWPSPKDPSPTDPAVVTAQLKPLTFPDDVHGFAEAWYRDSDTNTATKLADQLINHLRQNVAARELATVPLFLTFLCLVSPDADLPTTRTQLLDQVINRLLAANWHQADQSADLRELRATVTAWAWDAAANNSVSGLSEWPDTFITTPSSIKTGADRLDAIAPPIGPPRPGTLGDVERRFVHRAIREHLVASHVACLPARQAADVMLPHWWYDDTWKQVIPAVFALHVERDEALRRILGATELRTTKKLTTALAEETRETRLRIVVETTPRMWEIDNQGVLNRIRVANARTRLDLVQRSAHWESSNPNVVDALIAYLPNAGERIGEVVRALVDLDDTAPTRQAGVDALIAYLPNAGEWTDEVVRALVDLADTAPTRQAGVDALIAYLPNARWRIGEVVRALVDLDDTAPTRQAGVDALIAYLPNAGERTDNVVRALVDLDDTAPTRQAGVDALIAYLPNAGERTDNVVRALVDLDDTAPTRQAGVDALIAYLPNAREWTGEVVRALVDLDDTAPTRQAGVDALIAYLPNAGERTGKVVRALVDLDDTAPTRQAGVDALIAYLPNAGWRTGKVVRALVDLADTAPTRQAGVDALIAYLPNAGWRTDEVVRALVDLDDTAPTRQAGVDALIAYLPNARWRTDEVVRALVDLADTAPTRQAGVDALIAYLPNAGEWTDEVVRALVDLADTAPTRQAGVDALIAYLPNAGEWTDTVVGALVGLATPESTRQMCVTELRWVLSWHFRGDAVFRARSLRSFAPVSDWIASLPSRRILTRVWVWWWTRLALTPLGRWASSSRTWHR